VTALASNASFRKRARASRVPSGPLLVVTAALLWGTVGPAAALAGSQLSAVVLGGWRQALGGAVLVLPSLARGRHRELVALARSRAVLAAAAATGVFQVLFLYAVAQAGPGTATALALGIAPAATGACAWLCFREGVGVAWLVGTALCIGGTAALLSGAVASSSQSIAGLGAAIGAGVCYGAYTVAAKVITAGGKNPTAAAGVSLLLGCLPALPFMVAGADDLQTPSAVALVVWLGVIATGAAYWCFMRGLASTSAPVAGTLSLAEPVAALALGALLLAERLDPLQLFGCVAVVIGLAVSTTARTATADDRPTLTTQGHRAPRPPGDFGVAAARRSSG